MISKGVGLFAYQTACQVTSTDKSHHAKRPSCSSEKVAIIGALDALSKEYMRVPEHFADAIHFFLFDGDQVVNPKLERNGSYRVRPCLWKQC